MEEKRVLTEEERMRRKAARKKKEMEEFERQRRLFITIIIVALLTVFILVGYIIGDLVKHSKENQTTAATKIFEESQSTTTGVTEIVQTTEATTETTTKEITTEETTSCCINTGKIGTPKAHELYSSYLTDKKGIEQPVQGGIQIPSWIQQILLTENSKGRPMTPLTEVKHVIIHYTATPSPAVGAGIIRDNFQENDPRSVSSHFIVGVEGEIIQCVPLTEVAYAQGTSDPNLVNHNFDSISIENCHPDESGKFSEATYESLVYLTSWLLEELNLPVDSLMRHYDATGKNCPKYYVENPEAWEQFKVDVADYMAKYPNIGVQFP